MRNTLQDLTNGLFEQLERLQDDDAMKDPEAFDRELKRSGAVTDIASQIIQAGQLSLRASQYAAELGMSAKPILGLASEDK